MYTVESVSALLKNTSDEELITNNTKAMLSRMYEAIYGPIGYPSFWRKQDLITAMREYCANMDRAQVFVDLANMS